MDCLANREMMKLLYGSPTTYCFICHLYLTDPDKAHPKQHPTAPFRTVAYCDNCNSAKLTTPLKIASPRLQTCASCEDFFSLRNGPKKFCSKRCAETGVQDISGATVGGPVRRIPSRKSCGPCDCEDYAVNGWCTMTAEGAPSECLRDAIFEPRPRNSPRLGSPASK